MGREKYNRKYFKKQNFYIQLFGFSIEIDMIPTYLFSTPFYVSRYPLYPQRNLRAREFP